MCYIFHLDMTTKQSSDSLIVPIVRQFLFDVSNLCLLGSWSSDKRWEHWQDLSKVNTLWKGELYSKTILFLLRARRGLGTISKSSLQIHLHWPRLHGSYLFRDNNRVNFFHFSVQRMRTKSKRSDNQRQFWPDDFVSDESILIELLSKTLQLNFQLVIKMRQVGVCLWRKNLSSTSLFLHVS